MADQQCEREQDDNILLEKGVKLSVFVKEPFKEGYPEEHCLIEFQSKSEKDLFMEVVNNLIEAGKAQKEVDTQESNEKKQ